MKLGTHNGAFHADDVFAFVILSELYSDVELTRTRDQNTLSQLDIVFDVGGGEYDHHTTDKVFRNSGIPYAAAGLIWRSFGQQLIAKKAPNLSALEIDRVYQNIDESFMTGLDAIDNGVTLETTFPIPNLADAVSWFNPGWDSVNAEDDAFYEAAQFARTVFDKALTRELDRLRARDLVISAFQKRANPQLLVLEKGGPWLEPLLDIDAQQEVLFAVFPDRHRGYRLQTVRKRKDTFESRKPLPQAWAGLDGEELNQVTGIPDAIFCHPARFIAGAESFDSILQLAHLALRE